jgi:ABC-type transporter Mla subunit MlaD
VSALLASVSSLVQDEITPLVATLRGASNNLAAHVEDNLPPILYDVRHLVARVDGVVAQVEGAVQQAEADLGTVGEGMTEVIGAIDVDRINTTLAALTDAAARLDSVLAGAEQLIVHGDQLVVDAGAVLTETAPDIEVLTSDARYALQSASPRLNSILVNLERATEDLAGLLAELRANPAVLIGVEGAERSPGR